MATKHTPGPWRLPTKEEKDYEGRWLVGANGEPVLGYAGCGSHELAASESDMALIAAAPALADALQTNGHHSPACAVKAFGGYPIARWQDGDEERCTCPLGAALRAAGRLA